MGATIGGHFEAVQIPRFSGFYGPSLTKLSTGAVIRTEVDAGELLRELALVAVLCGASYFWLPFFVERAGQDAAERKLETARHDAS